MKIVTAPAGTNPMEMPELIKRKRASKLQLALLIGAALLVISCLCGGSYYLYSNSRKPAAVVLAPTMTNTATPTATLTSTPTATATPTITLPPISTLAGSATPGRTPTQIVSSPVVITRVVPGQDRIIEKWYPVDRTVVVHVPVTTTPGPTQTPWIITITQVVVETVIVEVTPTYTPTPTESIEPTIEVSEPQP